MDSSSDTKDRYSLRPREPVLFAKRPQNIGIQEYGTNLGPTFINPCGRKLAKKDVAGKTLSDILHRREISMSSSGKVKGVRKSAGERTKLSITSTSKSKGRTAAASIGSRSSRATSKSKTNLPNEKRTIGPQRDFDRCLLEVRAKDSSSFIKVSLSEVYSLSGSEEEKCAIIIQVQHSSKKTNVRCKKIKLEFAVTDLAETNMPSSEQSPSQSDDESSLESSDQSPSQSDESSLASSSPPSDNYPRQAGNDDSFALQIKDIFPHSSRGSPRYLKFKYDQELNLKEPHTGIGGKLGRSKEQSTEHRFSVKGYIHHGTKHINQEGFWTLHENKATEGGIPGGFQGAILLNSNAPFKLLIKLCASMPGSGLYHFHHHKAVWASFNINPKNYSAKRKGKDFFAHWYGAIPGEVQIYPDQ